MLSYNTKISELLQRDLTARRQVSGNRILTPNSCIQCCLLSKAFCLGLKQLKVKMSFVEFTSHNTHSIPASVGRR